MSHVSRTVPQELQETCQEIVRTIEQALRVRFQQQCTLVGAGFSPLSQRINLLMSPRPAGGLALDCASDEEIHFDARVHFERPPKGCSQSELSVVMGFAPVMRSERAGQRSWRVLWISFQIGNLGRITVNNVPPGATASLVNNPDC